MRPEPKIVQCHRCTAEVREGESMCECGTPTPFMTFDERREYEAARWRSYRALTQI